jgi:hypothetical protein
MDSGSQPATKPWNDAANLITAGSCRDQMAKPQRPQYCVFNRDTLRSQIFLASCGIGAVNFLLKEFSNLRWTDNWGAYVAEDNSGS